MAWKDLGIDTVVSLLEPHEQSDLDLEQEQATACSLKMSIVSFPIPDRGIPASFSDGAAMEAEKSISIHCRQAASLLISLNFEPDAAIRLVSPARGIPVPETKEQREWIESFAHRAVSK